MKNLLFCAFNKNYQETMLIPIACNGYSIFFNEDCYHYLNKLLSEKRHSKLFILVDENTHLHCLPAFLSNIEVEIDPEIIEIEAGEAFKNIDTCNGVWDTLSQLGADRKSIVINLGGGVVTDLGGFVASTFMRGIDFINVPTTLLAMVDASVGGKTGVDLGSLKNQIGVINVPLAVLIDTSFLRTLPTPQMRSGLAEMLKHGLIYDADYWNKLKNLTALEAAHLDRLIYESVIIKNTIVTQDPTENGLRKTLNFGHTLGHAIESYFLLQKDKKDLLHGEAIAVGMVLEAFLSAELEGLPKNELDEIAQTIQGIYENVYFDEADIEPIMELMKYDKKNSSGRVNFSLLTKIGRSVIDKNADNVLIKKAFDFYKK